MAETTTSIAEELIHRGYESSDLDYKEQFDESIGAWMEIAKDVFAMANAGGGHIVIGVKDGTFAPLDLDETFHIDSQVWSDKIARWATGRVDITYVEHVTGADGDKRKFPILRVSGSIGSLVVPKSDGTYTLSKGETKVAFKQGVIYTRRDTSSVACTGDEFWRFVRYLGGPAPEITWKPYKSTSTRQVVFPRVGSNGGLAYCEHFGGRLRFLVLGRGVYLLIEPIRVLTGDGENPPDQRRSVRISTKRTFYYHNNNYLYDMKLWLHILAGNRTEIHLGQEPGKVTVSIQSLNGKTAVGILDDRYTSEDFLDALKSEPFEYIISDEETEEDNPLTDTSMEEKP